MTGRHTKNLRLPSGGITPNALRELADAIDKLEVWHMALGGRHMDNPRLRRIEAFDDRVEAHFSTGPDVGGVRVMFTLTPNGWKIPEEESNG